jgi:O-antigen biosynthesis protein WbqP
MLRGDMRFFAPRPALFNQHDLIALLIGQGDHKLVLGFAGWAHINGRDGLPVPDKISVDVE